MNNTYPWKFCSIGGATRVRISCGEDIAHLGELDQKLWTALSCPTSGLKFDSEALEIMDSDHDGRIRVHEVTAISDWVCNLLKDKDILLQSTDTIPLEAINDTSEEGARIKACAQKVLDKLGSNAGAITLAQSSASNAVFAEAAAQKALSAWESGRPELPYAEDSDKALALVNEMAGAVGEFFTACEYKSYDPESPKAQESETSLGHPNAESALAWDKVNPIWAGKMTSFRAFCLDAPAFTKEVWDSVNAKLSAYRAWVAAKPCGEPVCEEAADLAALHKFLVVCRYLYEFLNNFVVFTAFYDPKQKSVFDAGELYIDQRCLSLCINVTDMAKQTAMASKSGMYILYCDCVSKKTGKTANIAAILTNGDTDNLCVGMNAVFYDRDGLDYDATVTKIIDNPTSVRQAFFHPYKKFSKAISDRINKKASEKESKVETGLTALASNPQAPAANAATPKKNFDLATFVGLFAGVGMGVGMLTSALASLVDPVWKPFVAIILLCLLISGPSMFLAWIKLRKRNLGPILNANGWAINSAVIVNALMGATLTSLAKYPTIVTTSDPFAIKKRTPWAAIIIAVLIAAGLGVYLYFKLHQ